MLAIDVDASGDLAAALGSPPSGFAPRVVQHNLSVLELRTDELFQEYLNIYFKVPRLTRLTPLARVFDFIATGVPGPRDMLVVGKIAYEERRKEAGRARRSGISSSSTRRRAARSSCTSRRRTRC